MIDAAQIEQILKQYKKHGWTPRRVLLSAKPDAAAQACLAGLEIVESEQDSIWFSRRSKPEVETWELRRITAPPFAVLAFVPDSAGADEAAGILAEAEERMKEANPDKSAF